MTPITGAIACNILPLSLTQSLPEAFTEWEVTGELIDHGTPCEHCQLCSNVGLRYHYGIENRRTKAHMWVGSVCILAFDIPMRGGRAATQAGLDKLVIDQRLMRCLDALERVAASEASDILRGALHYFEQHECLSPRLAWVVFWKLRQHKIPHEPRWFKIALRRNSHRRDLREMPTERVHDIWFALSGSQQRFALECGHTAAPELINKGKEFTYQEWRAAGWSDELLRQHELMR